MSESISFTFEGRELTGRRGESLAAALIAAGVRSFRATRTGAERGIFCGMGVCQDCLVEVDGETNRRACMVKLDRPVSVRRESFARELPGPASGAPRRTVEEILEETPEILVVGAGPGGLSAAIAARRAGAKVVVLDERSMPGGQYFKQVAVESDGAPPDAQHLEGRRLIEAARAVGVETRNGVDIWGAFPPATLAATQDGAARTFAPARLIVAAGAYERGVPFPGWTLPGVMTTGAAQTLWRSYRRLAGRRILIAGNGPLNFQVATELAAGGAEIAAVIELAEMPMARSAVAFAAMAIASPRLVGEGLGYRRQLLAAGIPVLYGSAVRRVAPAATGLAVEVAPLRAKHSVRTFPVDTVCLGYGFHPSNEILRALGCEHGYDAARDQLVTRLSPDGTGKTSIPSTFALGDCTGLGGARMALAQGTLAGLTAASELGHALGSDLAAERDRARREVARHRRFQAALWRLFAAPRLNLDLATSETVVCRCEEITAGEIEAAIGDGCPSIGDLKRTTRAGMGACQGRYCGPLLSRLMAERLGRAPEEDLRFAPRVPLKPVPVAAIARRAPQ